MKVTNAVHFNSFFYFVCVFLFFIFVVNNDFPFWTNKTSTAQNETKKKKEKMGEREIVYVCTI